MDYNKANTGYILNKQVTITSIEHLQYDLAYGLCNDHKARNQLRSRLNSISSNVKRIAILQKHYAVIFKDTRKKSEHIYHFYNKFEKDGGGWFLMTHELSQGPLRYALAIVRRKDNTAHKNDYEKNEDLNNNNHGFSFSKRSSFSGPKRWKSMKLFRKNSSPHDEYRPTRNSFTNGINHNSDTGHNNVDPLPLVAKSGLPYVHEPASNLESMVFLFETRIQRRLWKDRLAVCIGVQPNDTSDHEIYTGNNNNTSSDTEFPSWFNFNTNNASSLEKRNSAGPVLGQRISFHKSTSSLSTISTNSTSPSISNTPRNIKRQSMELQRHSRIENHDNSNNRRLDDILEASNEKLQTTLNNVPNFADLLPPQEEKRVSEPEQLPHTPNLTSSPDIEEEEEEEEEEEDQLPITPIQTPKQYYTKHHPHHQQVVTPKSPYSGRINITPPRKATKSLRGEVMGIYQDDEKTLISDNEMWKKVEPVSINKNINININIDNNNNTATTNTATASPPLKSMEQFMNENKEIKQMIDMVYNGELPEWHVLNGPVYDRPPSMTLPSPPSEK